MVSGEKCTTPFEHLLIKDKDLDDKNILQHFATTNEFIQSGLDFGGSVSIHWLAAANIPITSIQIRTGNILFLDFLSY
jgi:hypothetical protein